jgi:hypothetical protein
MFFELYAFMMSLRPCAMVVPDFDLISEIMMVAEGFTDARLLARKFITLYSLCKELLSKQVSRSCSSNVSDRHRCSCLGSL